MQFPDNLISCMDVDHGNTRALKLSDVCTSCVCISNDDQQSSKSQMPNTSTAIMPQSPLLDNTSDSRATTQSTVQTDYDFCVEFYEWTSRYKKADSKPCSSLVPLEHFDDRRSQASLMTCQELDLVLMGSLMTTIHDHDTTVSRGRHKPVKRTKISSHFMHIGYHVCINTFAFLFGIGANHRIKAIKRHYMENGMEPRVHKNTKRLPIKTASYEDILALVKFLQNYAETNAILLPGRIPGYKRDDLKLLPSNTSKKVNSYPLWYS